MRNRLFAATTGMLALFAASSAVAQSTTNVPVGVSLIVGSAPSCTVNGAAVVAFVPVANPLTFFGRDLGSNVNVGGNPGSSQALFSCNTIVSNLTLQIDAGLSDSGGVHRLASGTNRIKYRIYSDSSGASGEYLIGVPQPFNVGALINPGTIFSFVLYGYIDQADINAAPPGTYSDTLSSVVTF